MTCVVVAAGNESPLTQQDWYRSSSPGSLIVLDAHIAINVPLS